MGKLSSSVVVVHSSPMARRLLLHLYSIGQWTHYDKPAHVAPFTKPGAGISWIMAGRGRLLLDNSELRLQPGHFLFYGSGHTRMIIPDKGHKLVSHAFWFAGPGLESWLEELDTERRPQFTLRHPKRVYRAYDTMVRLVRQQPRDWEVRIHAQLNAVLSEFLLERNLTEPGPTMPPAIATALNAVEADPARNWKATDLAQAAGMGYSSFRLLFRKIMDETPHDYLLRVRLSLGREMLANPSLLIKEIAGKLHFANEHYFSSFFRQHAGVTPTQFRRTLLRSSRP